MISFLTEIIGLTMKQIRELRNTPGAQDVLPIVSATLPREARALASADPVALAAHVTAPVLLLLGETSPAWAPDITHALSAALPQATLAVLPDIGHEAVERRARTDLPQLFSSWPDRGQPDGPACRAIGQPAAGGGPTARRPGGPATPATRLPGDPAARRPSGRPGGAPGPNHAHNGEVRISIEATDLPGTLLRSQPGLPGGYQNIHVGVQRRGRRDELLGLVPGDVSSATWTMECTAAPSPPAPT